MRRRKGGVPLTAHTGKNAGTGRGGVASLVTNRPPSGDDNRSYLRPVGGLLLGSPSSGIGVGMPLISRGNAIPSDVLTKGARKGASRLCILRVSLRQYGELG